MLLFSTGSEAPTDFPLSILTDHSFGIQSVAFSQDSRWLCSLGNLYDGFLLLYHINLRTGTAKLHSSNRCTNVHHIVWMGNSVVSIGPRHVKVWRVQQSAPLFKGPLSIDATAATAPASPGPKTFHGRNCVLGDLIDATFACAVAISDHKAILCTTQGDICLLDDSDKTQRLETLCRLAFGIHCIHLDQRTNLVWFGGRDGRIMSKKLDFLVTTSNLTEATDDSMTPSPQLNSRVLAVGSVHDSLITVNSDGVIDLRNTSSEQNRHSIMVSKSLVAHESAVLGSCSITHWHHRAGSEFLTYSAQGTLLLWNLHGKCCGRIEISISEPAGAPECKINELKVVAVSSFEEVLYAGDRMGMLQ